MHFDFDALAKHINNDKQLLSDLLSGFTTAYPILCEKICTSIQDQNYDALEFNAHSLKGMVSNFFSQELRDHAYALELIGQKKDLEGARNHHTALKEKIPLLIENINKKFQIEKA